MRIGARRPVAGWMIALLSGASISAGGGDVRLTEAVKNKDYETVRALLKDGADVNTPEGDGATTLHWAVRYHVQLFSDFVAKLRSTPDGDGSLLDHVMLLYGAALRDGDAHQYDNLPLLVVGRGGGEVKGNRHLVYPADSTPMTNLQFTMLQKLGVPVDHFGDSTGELKELSNLS